MRLHSVLQAAVVVLGSCVAAGAGDGGPATRAACTRLSAEMEANLQQHVLKLWFPRAVDRAGGFAQNFGEDWSPQPGSERGVVYQARLTWTAAQVVLRYPAQADEYKGYARHGASFLADVLWDKEQGGFYWAVDGPGKPARGGEKHAYGVAFGIYALVSVHAATKDDASLDLAKRAFLWLDEHAHDDKNGGCYEALDRAGKPLLQNGGSDPVGTQYGRKSMNTQIHLLEAFTALHGAWPDPRVKARLEELFLIVRDKIVADGRLELYFLPDWQPVPGVDSFGHDVEAAYLLTEAAGALGKPEDERTWTVARQLVDHALQFGWDKINGGFFYEGRPGGDITAPNKAWWTQAEGLNALLTMHERFGRETPRYWDAFLGEWDFIQRHQVDAKNGGWLREVSRDGKPQAGQIKSNGWTECYHQSRAMMNVGDRLRKLAGSP